MLSAAISKEGRLGLQTPIDILTDDVLLEIFNHHRLATEAFSWSDRPFWLDYIDNPSWPGPLEWKWHRLAHVCRRWRTVMFSSQHRLQLQLVYTYNKPARKNLDCWPDLPLSIRYPRSSQYYFSQTDEENVIAALKYPGRICEVDLVLINPLLEMLVPLMQDPFPMLETLRLVLNRRLSFHNKLLGGSAPRLCHVYLTTLCVLPTLPQFLLTAPALVSLRLSAFPLEGYLSPGALVAGLGAMPNLEILHIDWNFSGFGEKCGRSPDPQTRAALPALTEFRLRANNKYLEDLIPRMDTPNVEQLFVASFDHLTFDYPRLAEFISRTKHLTSSPHRMSIRLYERSCAIVYYFAPPFPSRIFELQISCNEFTGHIEPLTYACRQLSHLHSNVERLDMETSDVLSDCFDKPGTVRRWLELFSLFGTVRMLKLNRYLVPFAVYVLEQSSNMGSGAVFPFLRDLHFRDLEFTASQLESFLAVRQRSGHIVSIDHMSKEDYCTCPLLKSWPA